ncbi:hypothetical protein D0T50_00510 [Bacteroides sp. 214]|uniref:sensor histidine kinase n=1 Tax=Bacteroides sp. 214 TaxID=2302935 RepID=UPI0013D7EBF2|nr:sensor histidine kinase [Bacteroides sp. 214]NDW11371.1 hypothetical protein [Bacteroides sp. 214]
MKRQFTYILLTYLLLIPRLGWADNEAPQILIINSYNTEQIWVNNLVAGINEELMLRYPNAKVFSKNLNIDSTTKIAQTLHSLRSALWALVEKQEEENVTGRMLTSIFSSGVYPDLIVLVGDPGFLFYQYYDYQMRDWLKVPIVVTGINDFISDFDWMPGVKVDYDSMIPIEKRHTSVKFLRDAFVKMIDPSLKRTRYVEEESGERISGYQVEYDFRLTGVKTSIPVQENLQMIQELLPDLEEIIWVDEDSYDSGYAHHLVKEKMKEVMPQVKFSTVVHTRLNSDSIFNEMLRADKGKAYLTFSWTINGVYSRFSKSYIKTTFAKESKVPLFSLTEPAFIGEYRIGGVYRPTKEWVEKTMSQIEKVLSGKPANDIPFETVTGTVTRLDQVLLNRYKLSGVAHERLTAVDYENIPPTFFEKYEKQILISLVVATFFLGLFGYMYNQFKQSKIIRKERDRNKKLFDKLRLVYRQTSVDFALYDEAGDCLVRVQNGKKVKDFKKAGNDPFLINIFKNKYLTNAQKEQIRNKKSVNIELEDIPCMLVVKPFKEPDYRNACYMILTVSLKELMQERVEREQFEKLFDFASDTSKIGIAFYNLATGEKTVTNSWIENLNEPPMIDGLPQYTNVVSRDRKVLLDYRAKVQSGETTEPLSMDMQVHSANGNLLWMRQHIYLSKEEENLLIELNLNIDELKRGEEELRIAKEKAEQSNRDTQEFLNSINHEIRTPLNSIVGYSTILSMVDSDEELEQFAPIILKNNELLTILINDIIELSRIDSGEITFKHDPVPVAELFKEMKNEDYLELYDKNLSVIIEIAEENPVASTDEAYLKRVLSSLFSNAVKFTDEGTVALGYEKRGNFAYFYVRDTGCGISEENLQTVFKRFYKENSYSQGTGLGLPLCKTIVNHLGGEIGVESEKGKGSLFWFTLPLF